MRIRIPSVESVLLFYYITLTVWKDLIFSRLPGGWILPVCFLLLLLFCTLLKQYRHFGQYVDVLLLYLVMFLLFLFKFWNNPAMEPWITRSYGLFSMISWGGIYGYAVIRLQKNTDEILNCLKKAGIVLLIYYTWKSLEVLRNGYWTYEQFGIQRQTLSNMSWSYGMLAVICFLSIYFFREKKRWMIVIMAVCAVGILLYGSRGTLIAIVVGVFLFVLLYHENKFPIKNYLMLFMMVGLCIFFLSNTGLTLISNILESQGLNSRFIDSLVNYTNFEDSSNGRMLIWMTVLNLIITGPFYGYGVYGERNVVYNLGMKWGYSHNILLEILVDFGWLLGGIIIIALVIGMVRFFIDTKNDRDEKMLFIIFLTITFELVLSNTIWLHSGLWILMGLYVNHFKRKQKRYKRRLQ